ncbi:MAG: hypothetical protein ISS70_15360 [Phycisphaerae bacterium]|nr:hypothetical protein [Phycisphaerae bacterium]
MGDAAHGESLDHEVYSKPLKVEPQFESIKTPDNYRRYPGGDKLPDTMKVWCVQNTGKRFGGVVARSYGFTDSPDAEIIALGVNVGKEYGAVGVGRHGNILQWGYSAPPSKMTDAGRKLFVNCIHYIRRFDGKGPLVYRSSSHRMNAIRLAALIDRIKDERFFSGTFGDDLKKKYDGNPDGLVQYYRNDLDLIYRDKTFRIDGELKSLGINSNREVKTLARLISLLKDAAHAETARRLLARYTNQSFGEPERWQSWFEENKDRIYFTDVGGYKFLVVPQGYLDTK